MTTTDATPVQTGASDVFDPTDDGFSPRTLAEVSNAGRRAVDAAEDLLQDLHGCMTPMNLRPLVREIESALQVLKASSSLLDRAQETIERDAPLSLGFGDDEPTWPERGLDLSGPVLSPRQLLGLAKEARRNPGIRTTTYSKVMIERKPVPSLILDKRWHEESLRRRESLRKLHDELLEDMESRTCDSCLAEPGMPCLTSGGGITGPHVARRKASPLAAEHPEEATIIRRVDPKYLSHGA